VKSLTEMCAGIERWALEESTEELQAQLTSGVSAPGPNIVVFGCDTELTEPRHREAFVGQVGEFLKMGRRVLAFLPAGPGCDAIRAELSKRFPQSNAQPKGALNGG
jgi:hypothetical protein